MTFDDLVGVHLTDCPGCGEQRWYGYGPCDTCGTFLPDSPDNPSCEYEEVCGQ